MKKILIIVVNISMVSCASLFNDKNQSVRVYGGVKNGTTVISSPEGQFELEGSQGYVTLARKRKDIPMTLVCEEGTKKSFLATTKFDWGTGWMDIFFWPTFAEAFMSESAYNIKDIDISGVCLELPKFIHKDFEKRKGVLSFLNQGVKSDIEARKTYGNNMMKDFCKGQFEVLAESNKDQYTGTISSLNLTKSSNTHGNVNSKLNIYSSNTSSSVSGWGSSSAIYKNDLYIFFKCK